MIPAIVYGVGAILGAYGQMRSNQAEAKAHELNAYAYQKQKEAALFASARELSLFEKQSAAFAGDQVSSFAKAGVDISGSALATIAGTLSDISAEHAAISIGAQRQSDQFDLAVRQSKDAAKQAKSVERFLMQSSGSLLNAYSGYMQNKPAMESSGAENPVAGEKARIESERASSTAYNRTKENPLFPGQQLNSSWYRNYGGSTA